MKSIKPYKGLRPYCDADAEIFFGRKEEIGKVLGYLRTRRLTILHGESGVGKTSTLRAGVAHRVKLESVGNVNACGYPKLAAVVFPGITETGIEEIGWWLDNPLRKLKLQIQKDVTSIDRTIPTPVKDLPFVETLAAWTDWLGGGEETGELFIILDHFEEFLERRDKNVGSEFVEAFADAANCRDLMVNFLVALRSSSFASLGELESAIPKIMANHIELLPLSRESARIAIEKPVEVYNDERKEDAKVRIDDELAEAILCAVDSPPIEMPYMQLILERLWENRLKQADATASPLSLEKKDLDNIGGAEGS